MSLLGNFWLFRPLIMEQFQQLCFKLRLDTLPQVTFMPAKIVQCMSILYITNNSARSATGHLPFLIWGGVRAMTGELRL